MAKRPIVIRFIAPIIDSTINTLMDTVDQKMRKGISEFIVLISSPGGNVSYGLSAYNYLKGIPASITTHNFGSVDSMGVMLFCGGSRRLSVPQGRFLIHQVIHSISVGQSLDEKQLEERLKGLRLDEENIAKVIAESTAKSIDDVTEAMHERTALNPEEAKEWGLVHEIKSELFEQGSEVISIQHEREVMRQQGKATTNLQA